MVLENKDVGFVRAGQVATIKLETFPYTRYGTVDGKVQSIAADAVNFAFLNGAQQFGLQAQIHFADFVQQQGAAVGILELAHAPRHGAGEGALLVAEQFALQQIRRNGAAVDRDEGLAGARATVMHGARHQFLASPRFPLQEHRRHAARHLLDQRAHLLHGHRLAGQAMQGQVRWGSAWCDRLGESGGSGGRSFG